MSTIRPKKDAQTLNGNPISTSDPLTGDALVWDGAEWTPTAGGGGGGSISGTIASAEIAFGTGVDTIGGSSNLTWNGNTVFVESPVDASGITVQDTGVTVITDIQSGAINMTSGFDEAYISGKDVLLRFRVDTAGGLIATIATLDETSVAAPLDLEIAELQINTDPGISGYVLTSNGAGFAPTWQASSGSGPAGGANEIQYNDGAGAFTASSNFTFDGATLNINSSAPSALTISSTIDGQFFDLNTSLYQLTLTDPTVAPTLVSTTIGPTDLAVFDGTSNQSGNVQAGLVGVFDNATTNNLKMIIPAGVATIKSEDALSAAQALNLSIGELQVNTDPGTSGYVLTSNGAGSAPTWQASGGAGLGSKVLLVVEGGSYATIQAAIDAAADNDIILVGPKAAGASWGPAVFSPGKRLVVSSLLSKWSTQVRVDSITFNANSGLNILLNAVFVRGLFINSSFTALAPGVNFYGSAPARLRLQECFVYNNNALAGTGIVSNNSGAGSSLYLDNSIVQSGASTGIGLDHQQGYTIIRGDSEISRYQYPLQCAAGTVEVLNTVIDGTGIANETVRITGGLVTCGYSTIKNTTTNASGVNLTNAGAVFGMGDATFAIATGTGYCVNGVAGSFFLYGTITYSNSAAGAFNVKVKNTITSLPTTTTFTSSP